MKASRLTALVAVLVASLMVGSPAVILGNEDLNPVGTAAAADEDRDFIIGVVDMTVATLNPNTYTMVAEGMIIFPLYSYLMQWDQSAQSVIGDLAKSWWVSPDGLTYEFELVDNAYFAYYDHDLDEVVQTQKVTSEDVEWSIKTLATDTRSRLNSYWPSFDGVSIIESTWTNSSTHFGIRITHPFVPYQESLMGNPIFPKYIWEDEDFINFKNLNPVGSGPFVYKTDGLPDAGYARLARNPYWFGEESYGYQIHVDEFVMKRYDDVGTLWTAVNDGTMAPNDGVDAMMGVSPEQFDATFGEGATPPENLVGFHQANGFVYEFNLNQMTEENRDLWGGLYRTGENSQLLLDPTVKKAISMSVDRDYLIDRHLLGYGTWTTTLEPGQNVMSHNYGEDGHDCILEPGATEAVPDPFDTAAARQLLMAAGWNMDAAGEPASPTQTPLYGMFEGDLVPLEFRFASLNTGGVWEPMCNDIVGWCREAGVQLNLELYSVNQLNGIWYAADYDIWLWDWVLTPIAEAVSGVMYLFTTDAVPSDSDVYLSDPAIDALYYEALVEMDFETRKQLCYDIQDLVYLNRGCQALAFRDDLYAFNTDCWENFGDLNNEYLLLPDVWPVWLCMNMNPTGNAAPAIGEIQAESSDGSADCQVGVPVDFVALGVTDDHQSYTALEYRWIWGAGGDSTTAIGAGGMSASHTFTEDGVYTVTLVAKETAAVGEYDDYLSSYKTVQVTVHDYSNSLPHSISIQMSPEDPTAGEVVTFTGSAVDDDGDLLYYSWEFGDGTAAIGRIAEHAYLEIGEYTVRLSVDDHRYGEYDRPAQGQTLVPVSANNAPWISVPDFGEISVKTDQVFTVSAGDSDKRDELLFTWNWGDGSALETTTVANATHRYTSRNTFTVTVTVDDQTGLDGHTASDSGVVYVVQDGNFLPVISDFWADPDSVYVGGSITFTARAADGDGDALTFTIDYGDDTDPEVVDMPATGPNDPVTVHFEKEYAEAGEYSVYLYVYDGLATATSNELPVSVTSNSAPVLGPFTPAGYWDTGVSMTFSVSADDDDGDTLTYTWDWDDGSPLQAIVGVGVATHTFAESGTYSVVVRVDDGKGLEDAATADVEVNWIPDIDPDLYERNAHEDNAYTYTVAATDEDGDTLTYMWDFGDSTSYEFGDEVQHTYADVGVYDCTVYVWDAFSLNRNTHNVSSTAEVTVTLESEDNPPTVSPIADRYAAAGEEITVTVYATDDGSAPLTYTWDWDDGTAAYVADRTESHTYAAVGDYTLSVSVDDGTGLPGHNVTVEVLVYVTADMPPIADAGGDRSVDEDEDVEFTGAASDDEFPIPSTGWAWVVNDTDGAHEFDTMVFVYNFATPGVYNVTLFVTDSIGQTSSDMIWVTVADVTPPTADAGPDDTVHIGTMYVFDGSGTDEYDTSLDYEWTFMYDGEYTTLTGASPSFTFDVMAVYTVTLRVTDDADNFAEDDMTLTVTDLVDPDADAGDDQTVDEGDTVTFDGSGSSDVDSSIVSYLWEFEYDGAPETLSGMSPTFVFDIGGVYVVTLTVEDAGGNTDSDTVTITVGAAVNEPPVADAGLDASVDAGDTHTFDGSGSTDDVLVDNYTWTFVYDGAPVTLYDVAPVFTFDIVGVYIVTLNVSDAEGLWDTDTVAITVTEAAAENEPPVADAGDDATIAIGATHTFSGAGSSDPDGSIANYTWTFTYDGQTRTLYGVAPSWTFEIEGAYVVTLTVTDSDGDTDTDTVTITVETDDSSSFIETYGLVIGVVAAIVVAAAVALMLMKRKGGKGASSPSEGVEGIDSGEPGPPVN